MRNALGVAVNSVTNRIYVIYSIGQQVTVIDGATNNIITTITLESGYSYSLAINAVTNKIYVAEYNPGCCSGPGGVTVIDGATNNMTTIAVGNQPAGIAVNPVTNKIY